MRICVAVFLCLGLLGCANGPYGNFLEHSTPAINQQLASATVQQMVAVYPPASTRLRVAQEVTDSYGVALLKGLRAVGYSVQEHDSTIKGERQVSSDSKPFPVNYIVDYSNEPQLYRVTLLLGRQSLSRAYAVQNDRLHPMGAWMYRE